MKRIVLFTAISIFLGFTELPAQYIWTPQQSNTTSNLNCVNFIDASKGLICGDNGIILKTTNKGVNWIQLNSNTNQNLNFIYRKSGFIWIVGDNGTMLKSADEGASWTQVQSGTSQNINSMETRYFGNFGYCPCDNGVILKSTNGGSDWVETHSVVSTNLKSIAREVICGDNGIILVLSNGNWVTSNSGVKSDLLCVTEFTGYPWFAICGKGGLLLNSRFGGWNIINSGTSDDLHTVYGIDNFTTNFLLSAGSAGTFTMSPDYGQNWESAILPTTQNMNGVVFIDSFTGWIVGNNGTILSTKKPREFFPSKIDGNNIRAWYSQSGVFNYYNNNPYNFGFEWPKGSGKYARFASSFLIGAVVNNDIRIAFGDAYGSGEFLPGYTSNSGQASGLEDSTYKIYELKYGVLDSGRIYWPNSIIFNSDQGAPVYYNNSFERWEPNDYGNQTMFFRMTDSYLQSHFLYGGVTSPLKADVKCINFCFHTQDELDNVIYSDYQIINRSNNIWRNAYFTFYTGDDTYTTGYVGSDTLINLGYSYGLTSDPSYGTNPPSVGFKIIRGANYFTGNPNDTIFYYEGKNRKIKRGYKANGMHSFNWFLDDGPSDYFSVYQSMEGKNFRNGLPIIAPNGDSTRYYYSGDPESNTGWTMVGAGFGWVTETLFTTTGPVDVNPGDTQHIVVAQVIAQGTNHLEQYNQIKRNFYNCSAKL